MLQQHEAQLASNAVEALQLASALEWALTSLTTQVQQVVVTVSQQAAPASAPTPHAPPMVFPSTTAPESQVRDLERYSGDPEGCNPFLTNCFILFAGSCLPQRQRGSPSPSTILLAEHVCGEQQNGREARQPAPPSRLFQRSFIKFSDLFPLAPMPPQDS